MRFRCRHGRRARRLVYVQPAAWLEALAEQAPAPDRQTVLVGHSIGATFILHVLERLTLPIAQSIFVAPVMDDIRNTEYTKLNHSFVHHTFNWTKIKANAGQVNILCGHDDPYLHITHAQKLHAHIGGGLQVVAEGGHLNAESGYTTLPQLMAFIK